MSRERLPIACTLTTKQAASQIDEWTELRRAATSVVTVAGGYRLTFVAEAEATVRDLAAREAECCAFLTLSVERETNGIVLTITGPDDAASVIELIIGA